MFHRFSATPAKARSQKKNNKIGKTTSNSSPEHAVHSPAKRQKAARACDRCRLHRIKCDEQKPCAQCISIKAECIVSSAPRSSHTNNGNNESSLLPPRSPSPSTTHTACRDNSSSDTPSCLNMGQEIFLPDSDNFLKEPFNLPHVEGFSHTSVLGGCLFPQLPHPAVPSGEHHLAPNPLLMSQRSYYLRIFWDFCHPLLQIMNKTEFTKLNALPPPTMVDEYSARSALIDSMIALGIQYSHTTGLARRVLGLQQSSPQATWPGFEYIHRCCECMRSSKEVTLEALQCHTLMVLYLMKGNAFRDAYNLLGITVRKAYIAKLHRAPPSHLPEAGKTARMQLWWVLFSLDLQCALQLDMPPASQRSFVKCPFPVDDALARYFSSPNDEGINAHTYSTCLINLNVIVTDISACISDTDLVDVDSNSPVALEHLALNLSSAFQNLEVWRDQLPSELLLNQCDNGPGNTEMLDFDHVLALPDWLQRQAVFLELHYHNTYMLIQRPFIRLRYAHSKKTSSMISPPDSQQSHVDLHVASALHHATITIDTIFTICSTSDLLYGWSEVLQPLWNAALTIMAHVSASSMSSVVPQALDSLTRAQAVIELFSPTCPAALSAKGIFQSLVNSLHNMMPQGSGAVAKNDLLDWDLFVSLLEQQTSPTAPESVPMSNNLNGTVPFSPFMPLSSKIGPSDFMTMQFGDS